MQDFGFEFDDIFQMDNQPDIKTMDINDLKDVYNHCMYFNEKYNIFIEILNLEFLEKIFE